jgi:conjugative transposon TraK protein
MEDLFKLDSHFKRVRLVTIIALVSLGMISLIAIIFSYTYSKELSKRIYLVDKGKQFEAMVSTADNNRPVEITYHISRFHELFFSIAPDAKQIEDNVKKAFYLCDESAKTFYDDLKEQNYYNDMIQGNVVQKISVDSVSINSTVYPYTAVVYSKIVQTRATSSSTKNMITTCSLEDVPRSINSPNGLFMRNFKVNMVKNEK